MAGGAGGCPGVRVGELFSERICQTGDCGLYKIIENVFLGRGAASEKHFPRTALPSFTLKSLLCRAGWLSPGEPPGLLWPSFQGIAHSIKHRPELCPCECPFPGQAEWDLQTMCAHLHNRAAPCQHSRCLTFLPLRDSLKSFPGMKSG